MMNIEAEVRDMKQHIIEISKKMDELLYEREAASMMKLEERTLSSFFENEPDIYTIDDLKGRYKVERRTSNHEPSSISGSRRRHRRRGG